MDFFDRVARLVDRALEPAVRFARNCIDVPPMHVDGDGSMARRHMIVVSHSGKAVPIYGRDEPEPPVGSGPAQMAKGEYNDRLRDISEEIETYKSGFRNDPDAFKGIAFVIHGGNERPKRSAAIAEKVIPQMKADGYYPIFIIWDSWPSSAYPEQLMLVRSGRYSHTALFSAGFYLLSDLLSAVAKIIPAFFALFKLMVARSRFFSDKYTNEKELAEFDKISNNIHVKLTNSKVRVKLWKRLIPYLVSLLIVGLLLRGQRWFIIAPVAVGAVVGWRILVAALITAAAQRTWQNLRRRAHAMFRAPGEFDRKISETGEAIPPYEFKPPTGAIGDLLNKLTSSKETSDCPITIIAHSMGAMIANEAVQRYGNALNLKSFVYMAPACSIRDYAAAVKTLLKENRDVKAYILTLHPKFEVGERMFHGFLPRGSILEWLESFLDPPGTHLDRMLGKWSNTVRALHIFDTEIRDRIYLKAFPYDPSNTNEPRAHVEFNDARMKYWRPDFWWV